MDENCLGANGVHAADVFLMYITKTDGIYVTHSHDGVTWPHNLTAVILNEPISSDRYDSLERLICITYITSVVSCLRLYLDLACLGTLL